MLELACPKQFNFDLMGHPEPNIDNSLCQFFEPESGLFELGSNRVIMS